MAKIAPLETDPPKIGILCALEEYSEEHMALMQNEDNSTFMVMAPAKVSISVYADQLNNRVMTVDYIKGKVVKTEETP